MTASTATTESPVLLRRDEDGIATVTLNRPEKFNALSVALLSALESEFDALAADTSVRVVVLEANGKAFCAGHDLQEMRASPGRQSYEALFQQCARVMLAISRIPQPVIARVHGVATAAGCQLVATCDLAVCVEEARFAVSGVNLGLFCSTPMVALTRNMPRKQAMEMLLTGEFIDAQTAVSYGLVNKVVPRDRLNEEVSQLADKIAGKSSAAIALGKRLFYRQLEASMEAAYELASETMTYNMLLEDAECGINSFINKQPPPPWKGR